MADPPAQDPPDEPLLGLAGALEEDGDEGLERLLGRVHRSIARRELSGQAVDLAAVGLTGVLLEYVRAIFEALGIGKGSRRAE